MRSGSTTRWRAKEKSYSDYRKKHRTNGCVFYRLVQYPTSQVIEKTKHCLIIKNRFGYDLWDGCGVKQHLMVIPRRHVASLMKRKLIIWIRSRGLKLMAILSMLGRLEIRRSR